MTDNEITAMPRKPEKRSGFTENSGVLYLKSGLGYSNRTGPGRASNPVACQIFC
jgi:hypothetical protein